MGSRFYFTETMIPMKNNSKEYSDPQKKTLRQLLHQLEKSQKADIHAYSFGHLNQRNLNKIPRHLDTSVSWKSAKKPAPLKKEKKCRSFQQLSDANVKKMTAAFVDCHLMSSTVPILPTRLSPVCNNLNQSSARASQNICNGSTIPQTKPCSGSPHIEIQTIPDRLAKEELELSNLMLIKPRPQKCIRLHSAHDQNHFVESYFAGLTRKDQFSKLLEFEENIVMKRDLLDRKAPTGYKAVEKHEWKLTRELLKIEHLPRPNLRRLQVFSDVFEDICQDSPVLCEILREIKTEYDLYLMSLLESQPTDQHKVLLAELQGMTTRTVKTHHVEEVQQKVLSLEQEARLALQRNDKLRNELEAELSKLEPLSEQQEEQSNLKYMKTRKQLPHGMEQVLSLRDRICKTTAMIQELENELKHSMVPCIITDALQSSFKDTLGEVAYLQKSSDFLRSKIKALENYIERTLINYKMTKEYRANFWYMLKDIVESTEVKKSQYL
ncbi:uncharacterized protein C6orf118-like [Stegostoma tigrinum]|uniref:uncharacterized protein C6orf118-like n=1 Tax=Stegostoma tigrinum TaxID=3053191 RepID=UPI00202B2D2C|nr:uncharacterized protein C6orf118-like [Stegostoma tigrinum]